MKSFFQYLLNPSVVALLIGGTLTSIFGLMASVSKNEQYPKWITWGTFVAGLIVLGSGIYAGYQSQIATAEIQRQGEKIAELSQKNSELSEKIAGSITGGESYCYLMLSPKTKNIVNLMIISEGEFPVYDVEVQIHDLRRRIENFKNQKQKNMGGNDYFNLLLSSAKIVKVGNIGPNQGYPLGTLTLPNDVDMANYEIDIFARNGRVTQFVQYRKFNDKWTRAEKIHFPNNTVKKYIDKDFPKDEESKSFWNE